MFAQEANMHENRFNEYRIPSGMLIVFLEKALTLIHMETHLDDVSGKEPWFYRERCPSAFIASLVCKRLKRYSCKQEVIERDL